MMIRCYGIIPLRYEHTKWFVLLVLHQNGNHWALPKGHAMQGEIPRQTAVREFMEETGMSVTEFLDFPEFEEHYHVKHEPKQVIYYAALVEGDVALQHEEIAAVKWVPLSEAFAHATFPATQHLLKELSATVSEKLGAKARGSH
ncbi:MAG: NUDIX domain-containing protein [Verrucomicrobia bacterium]|nr:NUDIX domain-containing protein [Verrucomicrobiota bacterium]MBS0645077.1 NUDIX domain-containing protein [Verrucomicrobiota bacterium]